MILYIMHINSVSKLSKVVSFNSRSKVYDLHITNKTFIL